MDCRTHKGETRLHIASRAGHTAIVEDILARQAAAAAHGKNKLVVQKEKVDLDEIGSTQ
jgi:hypothetical protein